MDEFAKQIKVIERLKTGWTIPRFLFTGIGAFVFFDSIMGKEWLGIFIGSYFLYLGLFAKGCASNACLPTKNSAELESTKVEWEEVK